MTTLTTYAWAGLFEVLTYLVLYLIGVLIGFFFSVGNSPDFDPVVTFVVAPVAVIFLYIFF